MKVFFALREVRMDLLAVKSQKALIAVKVENEDLISAFQPESILSTMSMKFARNALG